MNAEEARKKSLQNSQDEIKVIKDLIENAVNYGKTDLFLHYGLRAGTQEWLIENGYKYHYFNLRKNSRTNEIQSVDTRIEW